MDFKTVPFTKVNDALEEKKVTGIEQRSYNTCFHKQEEIAAVLPDTEHKPPHSVQPWILLEPWLDVIMKTRNLHEADVHRIKLPGSFLAVLCSAFAIGIYMGRINASDAEDMEACFPKTTTRGIDISQLLRTGRYFVRLDTCSLKDAVAGGKGPVTSAQQLWTRLATSHRGCSGVMAMRAYDISAPIYLYLFPWDDNMRTELEYRVFCPPYSERIAAISQYRWHDRWQHADESTPDQRTVAERVLNGAEAIHRQLIDHPAMTEELKRSGFTFDIAVELGGENVRLIELNDFGAMSGCGSCLFQWIEDARVLFIDSVSLPRSRLYRIRCFSNFTRLGSTTGDDESQATSKVIADLSKAYRSKVRNRTVIARISRSPVSVRSSVKKESIVRKVHLGQGPAGEPTTSLQASTLEHGVDRGSLLSSEDEKQSGTLQIRKYPYELPFDRCANPMEIPLRASHSPGTEEMKNCDPVVSHDNTKYLAIGNRSSSKDFLHLVGTCRGESPPIQPVIDNCSMIPQVPYTSLGKVYPDTSNQASCGQGRAKAGVLGRTDLVAASVTSRDLDGSNRRELMTPAQGIANDQQARQEAIVERAHIVRSVVTRGYCDPDEVDSTPSNRKMKAKNQAEQDSWAEKADTTSFLTIQSINHPDRKNTEPMIRKYTFNDQKQATQDTLLDDVDNGFGDLLYTYNQLQLRKPRNQAKDNAVEWDSRKKYPHWQRVANNAEAIEEFGKAIELISQSIDRLNEDLRDLDVARDTNNEFNKNPHIEKATGRWPRAHDGPRRVLSTPKVLENRTYVGSEAPRITFVSNLPVTAVNTT